MEIDQRAPEKEEGLLVYKEDQGLVESMEKAKLDSHLTPSKKAANLETVTPVKRIVNPLAGAQGLCDDDQPLADTFRRADRRVQSAKKARDEKKARNHGRYSCKPTAVSTVQGLLSKFRAASS